MAANLLKHGHKVQCIDAVSAAIDHIGESYSPSIRYRGLPTETILERITEMPDAIGITAMFSQDWPHIENLINAIHTRFPNRRLFICGEGLAQPLYFVLGCVR